MNQEFIELILSIVGALFFIFFICGIVGGGMILICRPLDHQFEWEKRLQGLNAKNREIEARKKEEGKQ